AAADLVVPAALRAAGMPSCRMPGRPFGSSALRASGTKRSTGKFSTITRDSVSVIRLKFARQLGIILHIYNCLLIILSIPN
ncbi:MAG: hypothetical protein KAU41_12700, partial [Deltaproteobacteria bacterium]|nr:hypothetical protein [Deltaproteobacteria bacterium]